MAGLGFAAALFPAVLNIGINNIGTGGIPPGRGRTGLGKGPKHARRAGTCMINPLPPLSRYYILYIYLYIDFIGLGASGGLLGAVFGVDGSILGLKHVQEYRDISGQAKRMVFHNKYATSVTLPRNAPILFRCFRPGGALWTT
jgi:hypothetical protein